MIHALGLRLPNLIEIHSVIVKRTLMSYMTQFEDLC